MVKNLRKNNSGKPWLDFRSKLFLALIFLILVVYSIVLYIYIRKFKKLQTQTIAEPADDIQKEADSSDIDETLLSISNMSITINGQNYVKQRKKLLEYLDAEKELSNISKGLNSKYGYFAGLNYIFEGKTIQTERWMETLLLYGDKVTENKYFERVVLMLKHLCSLLKLVRGYIKQVSSIILTGKPGQSVESNLISNNINVETSPNDSEKLLLKAVAGNRYLGTLVHLLYMTGKHYKNALGFIERKLNSNIELSKLTHTLFKNIQDDIHGNFESQVLEIQNNDSQDAKHELKLNVTKNCAKLVRVVNNMISLVLLVILEFDKDNQVEGVIDLVGRYFENKEINEYYYGPLKDIDRSYVEERLKTSCINIVSEIEQFYKSDYTNYDNKTIGDCFKLINTTW